MPALPEAATAVLHAVLDTLNAPAAEPRLAAPLCRLVRPLCRPLATTIRNFCIAVWPFGSSSWFVYMNH